MANVSCPEGHDDQIQKIQAIRHSGVSYGSMSGPTGGSAYVNGKWIYAGGYSIMHGSNSTELAQLLEPPTAPYMKRQGWGCGMILGLAMILVGFLPLIYGPLVALVGLMGLANEFSLAAVNLTLSGIAAAFVALIFIVVGFFVIRSGSNDPVRKSTAKKFEHEYLQEKTKWDLAMAKYDRSYYCFRDNIVFDPQTNSTCKPEELQTWLYS